MSVAARRLLIVLFAAVAGLPQNARSAPCDVFTDVQDTDFFCNAVQWLRNRSITTGCGPAGLFCPNDPVPRAQMALFMSRLGAALEPRFLRGYNGGLMTTIDAVTPPPLCATQDFAATGYPRVAQVVASFNAQSGVARTFSASVMVSTNAGATWQGLPSYSRLVTAASGAYVVLPYTPGPISLEVGSTYRFAYFITYTNVPAGTLDYTCDIVVRIDARNPGTPPFDEAVPE
jgi:hypothetical protein